VPTNEPKDAPSGSRNGGVAATCHGNGDRYSAKKTVPMMGLLLQEVCRLE